MNFFAELMPNLASPNAISDLLVATWETLYMTLFTCIVAFAIGTFLGVIAVLTMPNGLAENKIFYSILDKLINIFRSIPFVILIALLVGVTRFIVGTSIGTPATLVPLVIGTVPFFARQVQNSLLEVDDGVIEAAQAMGLSTFQIVTRVYLIEGLPSLIRAGALSMISVVNLTAMAGTIGGGGLGNLAIVRGYNRYQYDVIWATVIIILIIVFVFQALANWTVKKIEH